MNTQFGTNKARKSPASFLRHGLLAAAAAFALLASAPAFAYTVQHPFAGMPGDGGNTFTSVIKVGNTIYGTTTYGGTNNLGTIFKLVGTTETVLYNFTGGPGDGAYPRGGLVYTKDQTGPVLIGTTIAGGSGPAANCPDLGSCGTVFKWQFNPVIHYSVVYNFQGGSTDGSNPDSSMALGSNDVLYGVTLSGGSAPCSTTYSSCGTLYSFNALTNVETPVYSFTGGTDGANPFAAPLIAGTKIYGTTTEGGDPACTTLPHGCGTVYQWNLASPGETVLYKFHGTSNNDGADPFSSLVKVGNTLWGTTFYGGTSNNGMVFRLTKTGSSWPETYTYNFTGGTDGGHPAAGLTKVGTTLYGNTSSGGNAGCMYYYSFPGCGTIFSITGTTLTPAVYSFTGATDGGNPYDTMLKGGAYLYGTTYGGGSGNSGTVFKF